MFSSFLGFKKNKNNNFAKIALFKYKFFYDRTSVSIEGKGCFELYLVVSASHAYIVLVGHLSISRFIYPPLFHVPQGRRQRQRRFHSTRLKSNLR
jgi:hypothetical protein